MILMIILWFLIVLVAILTSMLISGRVSLTPIFLAHTGVFEINAIFSSISYFSPIYSPSPRGSTEEKDFSFFSCARSHALHELNPALNSSGMWYFFKYLVVIFSGGG